MSSSAKEFRRCSFESGGKSVGIERVGTKERPVSGSEVEDRLAMGRMQVVRNAVTDLLR
jgi:hypothetical protein